jgi:hypothetical protein
MDRAPHSSRPVGRVSETRWVGAERSRSTGVVIRGWLLHSGPVGQGPSEAHGGCRLEGPVTAEVR